MSSSSPNQLVPNNEYFYLVIIDLNKGKCLCLECMDQIFLGSVVMSIYSKFYTRYELDKCLCQYYSYKQPLYRRLIHEMDNELILDVKMKYQSILFLKRIYYRGMFFQMGEMMFEVRAKFKRLLFLYKLAQDEEKYQCINRTIEAQQIQLEIDKLLHLVEEFEEDRQKRSEVGGIMKSVFRTNKAMKEIQEQRRKMIKKTMRKIKNNDKFKLKRQKHSEDGFDTDYERIRN